MQYDNDTIGTIGPLFAQRVERICSLSVSERVVSVHVYLFANTFVTGLKIVTSASRECGPYGRVSNDVQVVTGHQLLYISGGIGTRKVGLEFHFDYACTMTQD